jgi:hypothetical protein
MSDNYNFRLRFNLPSRLALNSDKDKETISEPSEKPEVYILASERHPDTQKRKSIRESKKIAIIGGPYTTEEEAVHAGSRWRSSLETSFAYMGLAVDFGDRISKGSFFTEDGLEWVKNRQGVQRVLNDVHGLMTFVAEPKPLFVRAHADLLIGIPIEKTIEVIRQSYTKNLTNSLAEQIAFDLYAASFSQPAADARFLNLMMAVETLVERKERPEETQRMLNELKGILKSSTLDVNERNSLLSALRDLKLQSIGDACKDLVSVLDRKYSGMDPSDFIKQCYRLRSKLVHGQKPRPTFEEVGQTAAGLEILVSHLLSRKLGIDFRETGITS